MKAVLLLALATSSLASPLYLAQLFEGFSSAAEPLGSCFEQPKECGRALAHVVSLLKENAPSYLEMSWDYQSFLSGFIDGVQNPDASNSACYNDFTQTLTNFASFFNALIHFNPHAINYLSVATLGCDAKSIFGFDYEKDCEFGTLIDHLKQMTFDTVISRYVSNMCPVNLGIVSLQSCQSDPYDCGFGAGTIFRIEVDWEI